MLFIWYPKCSTCIKAKKYLDSKTENYSVRDIKLEIPTFDELNEWYEKSGLDIKHFFNTSGNLYKSMNLKEKLPTMSTYEKLKLLSTDGMLIKRPIIVDDNFVLVGFKQSEWDEKLK